MKKYMIKWLKWDKLVDYKQRKITILIKSSEYNECKFQFRHGNWNIPFSDYMIARLMRVSQMDTFREVILCKIYEIIFLDLLQNELNWFLIWELNDFLFILIGIFYWYYIRLNANPADRDMLSTFFSPISRDA